MKYVKQIDHDQFRYNIRITKEDMSTLVSQTVMDLLAALTNNLKDTLSALLIANIITSAVIIISVYESNNSP